MSQKGPVEGVVGVEHATALHPEERVKFKSLILGNPNYFGNMPELGLKVVQAMSINTSYEELMCVGLQPDADKLTAVVNLKRHTGYDGDACSLGSREYVRFFVERAGVWHDLGDVSFTVHDMPNTSPLPLSYDVQLDLAEARKYCSQANLVNIRAILSWNWEPPAGNAGWVPPWGNVVNVRVEIAPKWWPIISLGDLLKDKLVELKPELLAQPIQQTLETKPPAAKSYAELKVTYADKQVPGHRFGFTEAQKMLKGPITSAMLPAAPPTVKGAPMASQTALSTANLVLGTELGAIIAALQNTQGDTTYERLTCAGYNPETRMLGGVVELRQSSGYSGALCDPRQYRVCWLLAVLRRRLASTGHVPCPGPRPCWDHASSSSGIRGFVASTCQSTCVRTSQACPCAPFCHGKRPPQMKTLCRSGVTCSTQTSSPLSELVPTARNVCV